MRATPYTLPQKITLAIEALFAVARARMNLHRTRPDDVLALNRAVAGAAVPLPDEAIGAGCAAVAFAIPRIAMRVPWRADCLVRALAGQQMLRRRGIASAIVVGIAKHADGTFESHAWLARDGVIILGGEVSRFEPLLDSFGPASGHG
jgi:hypothetical protein